MLLSICIWKKEFLFVGCSDEKIKLIEMKTGKMIKNINKSAYNFFLCIEFILHNRIFTLDDIISFLENFYGVFVFREAVLKYIRTLKLVGFEFERLDNKTYNLKNIPLKIDVKDVDKYNSSSDFFHHYCSDICYTSETENGADIILKNR